MKAFGGEMTHGQVSNGQEAQEEGGEEVPVSTSADRVEFLALVTPSLRDSSNRSIVELRGWIPLKKRWNTPCFNVSKVELKDGRI